VYIDNAGRRHAGGGHHNADGLGTHFIVHMDNLSAAAVASRVFPEALTAFIGFIQRCLSPPQGWQNEWESVGGLRRNTQMAALVHITHLSTPLT